MNKITIDNNRIDHQNEIIIKEDTNIYINNKTTNLNLIIKSPSNVFIYIKDSNLNIDYDLKSNLDIKVFAINSSIKTNIDLNYENISLNYYYGTINTKDNDYEINVKHNLKNTNSKVVNKGLNLTDSKLTFNINGYVKKNSTNVICNQENFIIEMEDNNSIIKPNLIIDNNDIEANHSAYIGYFNQEELFYLKSRGIKEEIALKLLAKAFLLGDNNIHFLDKEKILKDLNKYWR